VNDQFNSWTKSRQAACAVDRGFSREIRLAQLSPCGSFADIDNAFEVAQFKVAIE
jgi:hypothetical protein